MKNFTANIDVFILGLGPAGAMAALAAATESPSKKFVAFEQRNKPIRKQLIRLTQASIKTLKKYIKEDEVDFFLNCHDEPSEMPLVSISKLESFLHVQLEKKQNILILRGPDLVADASQVKQKKLLIIDSKKEQMTTYSLQKLIVAIGSSPFQKTNKTHENSKYQIPWQLFNEGFNFMHHMQELQPREVHFAIITTSLTDTQDINPSYLFKKQQQKLLSSTTKNKPLTVACSKIRKNGQFFYRIQMAMESNKLSLSDDLNQLETTTRNVKKSLGSPIKGNGFEMNITRASFFAIEHVILAGDSCFNVDFRYASGANEAIRRAPAVSALIKNEITNSHYTSLCEKSLAAYQYRVGLDNPSTSSVSFGSPRLFPAAADENSQPVEPYYEGDEIVNPYVL